MPKTDLTAISLDDWLVQSGTRTGTFTFHGVTYTDLSEVEWRQANGVWK